MFATLFFNIFLFSSFFISDIPINLTAQWFDSGTHYSGLDTNPPMVLSSDF